MTAKVERLVNLTVALLEARKPLSFAEIREGLHAYDQGDPESARRMFERDKDDLRRLGVPVETRVRDHLSGEQGYIIDRSAYELPDVELTAEEVASLALAVRLSGQRDVQLPLAKLAARSPDPGGVAVPVPAQVTIGTEDLETVAEALVDRQALAFTYRTATGAVGSRTLDPYAVVQRRGAWYVVGRDHDRDGIRAFRLDRMVDSPRTAGEPGAFAPPRDLDVESHVTGPAEARVTVAPELAWEAEIRGGHPEGARADGWPVYRFAGINHLRVLSWALALGCRAEILSPPELRERAMAQLHSLVQGGVRR